MNKRETKIITTTNGHKVEVYTYMTGGDTKKRNEVVLQFAQPTGKLDDQGNPEMDLKIEGDITTQIENNLIDLLVVSVDGKKETLKELDNLRIEDYQEVLKELGKIASPKKE